MLSLHNVPCYARWSKWLMPFFWLVTHIWCLALHFKGHHLHRYNGLLESLLSTGSLSMQHIWKFSPSYRSNWQRRNPNLSVALSACDFCLPLSHLSVARLTSCTHSKLASHVQPHDERHRSVFRNPKGSQSPAGKIVIVHRLIELRKFTQVEDQVQCTQLGTKLSSVTICAQC